MAIRAITATGNAYIDGILAPNAWDHTEITYSYPSAASNYGAFYASNEQQSGFSQFSAGQQAYVDARLAMLSAYYIPITFTKITETDETHAIIRFANSSVPNPAHAYTPDNDPSGGDVWIDPSQFSLGTPVVGTYTGFTYDHEIGHALGLKHAHEIGTTVPTDQNYVEFTIMSYGSFAGGGFGAFTIEANGYPTRPMTLDIRALQYIYGSVAPGSGDITYKFNPTTGVITRNGSTIVTPPANRIFTTQPPERTSGVISWDLSDYTTDLDIDLRPGEGSIFSDTQIASLGTNEDALANAYVPVMHGGETDAMPTRVKLGTGADTVVGNSKANTIALLGNRADYTFGGSDPYTLVKSGEGLKTFTGIEVVEFADETVQLYKLIGSRLVSINFTAV